MAKPVNRTLEEKFDESERKRKKSEGKVTDLSTTIIGQLSRERSDDIKIKLLCKRLADKERLFADLLRIVATENMEAAIAFISVDLESYVAREGTPALDKEILKIKQQISLIVSTIRDESETYKSFRTTLCNKIIDQINGLI